MIFTMLFWCHVYYYQWTWVSINLISVVINNKNWQGRNRNKFSGRLPLKWFRFVMNSAKNWKKEMSISLFFLLKTIYMNNHLRFRNHSRNSIVNMRNIHFIYRNATSSSIIIILKLWRKLLQFPLNSMAWAMASRNGSQIVPRNNQLNLW